MRRALLGLFLVLLSVSTGFGQAPAVAAPASGRDWAAFIGPFPGPGTEAAKEDAAILLWHQRTRTQAEVQRALSEVKLGLGAYLGALGTAPDGAMLPKTAALLDQVGRDLKAITDAVKNGYARPRPYLSDSRVIPAIERESSPSYPSGHATRGMAFALVLAELVPARREALVERGRQVGVDRVIGGVHWPSDIEAGQRLGAALVEAWLADPANRRKVDETRAAEWLPAK